MRPVWDLPLDPAGLVCELDNGGRVRVRPVRRTDRENLLAAFEHFSAESRYMRFFSPQPKLTESMLDVFTNVDDVHQLAWAVFDPDRPSETGDPSGLAIATARLFVDPADRVATGGSGEADGRTAEATLAVVDDYQRKGIGRFLIDLLVSTASIASITLVRFEVLHENHAMRALLRKAGATAHAIPGDRTVVEFRLPVPPPEEIDVPLGAVYALLRHVEDGDAGPVRAGED